MHSRTIMFMFNLKKTEFTFRLGQSDRVLLAFKWLFGACHGL